jgi:hypothetical protein
MYNVGDRWIWTDSNPLYTIRGYISELFKNRLSFIIKWENGRETHYNDYMIKKEPRLSIDKEYYRNQKLESLGI